MAAINDHIRHPERGAPLAGLPPNAIPADAHIPEGWELKRSLPSYRRIARTRAGLVCQVSEDIAGETHWGVSFGMGPAAGIDDLAGVEMYASGRALNVDQGAELAETIADRLRERGAIPFARD